MLSRWIGQAGATDAGNCYGKLRESLVGDCSEFPFLPRVKSDLRHVQAFPSAKDFQLLSPPAPLFRALPPYLGGNAPTDPPHIHSVVTDASAAEVERNPSS